MSDNPTSAKSAVNAPPNDLLASEIANCLVAENLIKEGHKVSLISKLKSGGVRKGDWRLWIDLATAPQPATPQVVEGSTSNGQAN